MERKFSFSFFIPIYQILSQRFETLNEVNVPRTFLLSKFRTWPQYDKISKVIYPSDGRKYLLQICLSNRVLEWFINKVQYLPSVVTVIFRPYLHIHQKLFESVCSLYNLPTLILYYCGSLVELPAVMCKLIRLHHLDISHSGMHEMPSQMDHFLQKLSNYRAGKQSGNRVAELRELSHIGGSFQVVRVVVEVEGMPSSGSSRPRVGVHARVL